MGQVDFNKLWQNFMDTVQNHYMDFSGRVGRAQFWYYVLVVVAIGIAAAIVGGIVGTTLLSAAVSLALLLPNAGMAARRMQDTGRSGQLVWIWVIVGAIYGVISLLIGLTGPLGALAFLAFFFTIGWLINLAMLVITIVIIYFCAQPGNAGDNAFGPAPAPWSPGA
ncbi:MAG TPA: DUF805 domain-containing protein [Rhizomicrobium sp.]|jgi:uncharacterized membrane protein YhaH (DUF805 family)|nr:DUF805 domain-containing protein [Rhizomicrobium sp.]